MLKRTIAYHRRYHWGFLWKTHKNFLYLVLGSAILSVIISGQLAYIEERDLRLTTENNHRSLIVDIKNLTVLGSPGYTKTDWTEGTDKEIVLRRVR